jgi:hypothetical protein
MFLEKAHNQLAHELVIVNKLYSLVGSAREPLLKYKRTLRLQASEGRVEQLVVKAP